MKIISLKEFALTGQFGPVQIGMTEEEVLDLLGEPEKTLNLSKPYEGIAYNWYEFFFVKKTGKLYGIQNDHLQFDCSNHEEMILFKNEKFKVDTWFIEVNRELTRRDVRKILKEERIPFTEKEHFEDTVFLFESGVYLDFDNRDGSYVYDGEDWEKDESVVIHEKEDEVLNGIRYYPK